MPEFPVNTPSRNVYVSFHIFLFSTHLFVIAHPQNVVSKTDMSKITWTDINIVLISVSVEIGFGSEDTHIELEQVT
jgi:hypothetical protein